MSITMETASGRSVDLLHPDSNTIWPEDIAHHLSLINRFNGATDGPYSVAQHSCLLVQYAAQNKLGDDLCKKLLLHDAHEAYMGDITRPCKQALTMLGPAPQGYAPVRILDYKLGNAIAERFGIDWRDEPRVKELDNLILLTEGFHLMPSKAAGWNGNTPITAPPLDVAVKPLWPWYEARDKWMFYYNQLWR